MNFGYLIMPLLAVAASNVSTGPVHAGAGDELFKLLPDDGATEDDFGRSVAISGASAIVGAPGLSFFNAIDSGSGAAYLFDTSTGLQVAKLLPDDGAAADLFGQSVAISDAFAIVGAIHDDDNGQDSGSAYLFDISAPAKPVQIAKLLPDDGAAGDGFGRSVAISGTIAIVGSDQGGGSAYIFDTTTGQQLAKLLPDDGAGDAFGVSVAISGATAIVGAWLDDDNGLNSGSAYLFDISDPANPAQTSKLLPDVDAFDFGFGLSVAMTGAAALVGAPKDNQNGDDLGSAYLFDISDPANPTLIFKLLPDDGAEGDEFGVSVAIGAATAIVGAHFDDDNGGSSGSAYVFHTTTGQQIAKLLPNDGEVEDEFGLSVAISGANAIVGAHQNDDNGNNSGSAYLLVGIAFDDPEEFVAFGEPNTEATGNFDGDGALAGGGAEAFSDVIVTIPAKDPKTNGLVQVFLNQANDETGDWLGLLANDPVEVGREPTGVAVGFLNDDAFLDAVASNAGDDNLTLLFNDGTGNGTFLPPVNIPVGERPSAVAVADINIDGLDDIIVTNEFDDNLLVLFNDGDGGFGEAQQANTGGGSPIAIEPECLLDGDDVGADLAGINRFAALAPGGQVGSVFIIFNNNGKLEPAITFDVGVNPKGLSVGDVDNDGLPDIVVVNADDATISILINQGDGMFVAADPIPVGFDPRAIEAVDLDGDFDVDLAIAADDEVIGPAVQVLRNVGFTPGEIVFDAPLAFSVEADPNFVVDEDLNLDALNDLVTVNNDTDGETGGSVTALINDPPPLIVCPWDLDGDGNVSTADLLLLLGAWGTDPGGPPDFDGDGNVGTTDLLILIGNWGPCP